MVSTLAVLLFSSVAGFAREVDIPTPPWRNVVDIDDTYVFYLLVGTAALLLILIWVVAGVIKSLGTNKELWADFKTPTAKNVAALVGIGFALPSIAMAEELVGESPFIPMTDSIFWTLIITNVFLAVILTVLLVQLSSMIKRLKGEEEAQVQEDTIFTHLAGTIPLENEQDILLDHEYDGIRELDNKLPPWWLYLFYATIVFGVIYFPYYHFGGGDLQTEEFNKTMEIAELERTERLAKMANNVDENSVTMMTGAADLAKGQELFVTYCRACHLEHGGGAPNSIGPNLTDEYWLHGGGIKEVFTTIKYGVPQKGMIAWQTQLTPPQMQQLASFILSIQGTEPEGAKEPQGELWVEGGEPVETASDSTDVEEIAVADTATVE